jgi:hypothetical protein
VFEGGLCTENAAKSHASLYLVVQEVCALYLQGLIAYLGINLFLHNIKSYKSFIR